MGWTFQNRPKGTTDREFFQDLMGERYTIVECATVNPRSEDGAFYAAARTNEGPEAGTVWAFVSLVRWVPADFYNFGYKDMCETMGPVAEAPARVLDALTPLPECGGCQPMRQYGYCSTCTARQWRTDSRTIADNRARAAKVKPGQVVRFAKPITFTSGTELDTLTFEQRDTFRADGCRYRITGWRTMSNWELVTS